MKKTVKQLDTFLRKQPKLGQGVYIAKSAGIVGDVTLGAHSSIWYGAVIGKQSIVGAKALVTQGMKIPSGSLVVGAPARVVRKLTKQERAKLKWWAQKYVANGAYFLKNKINVGGPMPS